MDSREESACSYLASCPDPYEYPIWDPTYSQLQSTLGTSSYDQNVAGQPAVEPSGLGTAAVCELGVQLSEQLDMEHFVGLEAMIASDLAEQPEVGFQLSAEACSTSAPLPTMSPWHFGLQTPTHTQTLPVLADQAVSSELACMHVAMASLPVIAATTGHFSAAAAAKAKAAPATATAPPPPPPPPPPDSAISFLSRQAAPGLHDASDIPTDPAATPGHQAPSSAAAALPSPVGLLTLAGRTSNGANCSLEPTATSDVTPASKAGASSGICKQCILLQQALINLAATWPANNNVQPADKSKAAHLLAAAAACPHQCLIEAQLPVCSGSSDIPFTISLAKARLARQGGQRAPAGTERGRNFNLNCNAPCIVDNSKVSSFLGLRLSDQLFTVVSSDCRSGLTAIALARLPQGLLPAEEGCSSSNNPVSSSKSLEHLWCSGGMKCTKTTSQYKDQVFDLFTYALFLNKKQASCTSLAGTKRKIGDSRQSCFGSRTTFV